MVAGGYGTVALPARTRRRPRPALPRPSVRLPRLPRVELPRPGVLARGAVAFVASLPESSLLDRVIRGRIWIPLLGVLLVGIVGMQVENLKLNAGLGGAIEQTATLQSRNDWLRDDVAQLSNPQRIEGIAARHGMLMAPPSVDEVPHGGRDLGFVARGDRRDPRSRIDLFRQSGRDLVGRSRGRGGGILDGTGARRLIGAESMAGIRARAGKVDRRVGLLFGIFLLLLVVALGRALYLGTVKASALRAAAFTQQIDVQPVPAQRGLITDSAGTPLALSQATEDLIADPYLIIRQGDANQMADKIAPLLHLPRLQVLSALTKADTGYSPIAKELTPSAVNSVMALKINDKPINGLYTEPDTKEVYPRGDTLAQVLGSAERQRSVERAPGVV